MATDITLSDNTSEAIAAIAGGQEHLVVAYAEQIRANFEDNVHVLTGAMQASASVITATSSDYAEHVAAAAALNPAATFAPEATVDDRYTAVVQVPVGYGGHEEFGTIHRPAHPALVPAVEAAIANADEIAKEVFGL